MEFFRIRRDIPFMRHALVFNIISAVTFLAAVFFLATRGLHFSIEFIELSLCLLHLGILCPESRAQVGIGCCCNCTGVTQIFKQAVGSTTGVPLG